MFYAAFRTTLTIADKSFHIKICRGKEDNCDIALNVETIE